MKTKLTLRLEEALVNKAKEEARRRGKSVSGMVAEFFDAFSNRSSQEEALPPITASLAGILKGKKVSQADYKKHLREKYL